MTLKKKYAVVFTIIFMLFAVMPHVRADTAGNPLEKLSVDKTATPLDSNLETQVSLTFPTAEEVMPADIVFVLDKSGASAEEDIYKKAKAFLESLHTQAVEKDIDIKVSVVLFNNIGNIQLGLTDIRTGYDEIIDAMNSQLSMGTNLHAGLLAGKSVLDSDSSVLDSRKHMIVITDGATYLWSKNDDYRTSFTRSYGDPAQQTNPVTGQPFNAPLQQDRKGGIWEFVSRDNNVQPPQGETFWSDVFRAPELLGQRLEQIRSRDADYEQYDYAYNLFSVYLNMGRKTTPITPESVANIETAALKTVDCFDEIDSKYTTHVFYLDIADYNGSALLEYMKRNSGGLSTDFATIDREIINVVDKGSYVEDIIGDAFDFVNNPDTLLLKVGSETLTPVRISDTEYGFGPIGSNGYRYTVKYENVGREKLTLFVNESVTIEKPVTLTYHEKLVDVPTVAGTYEFDTNESAVLHVINSGGDDLGEVIFPKPVVDYEVPSGEPTPTMKPTSTVEPSAHVSSSSNSAVESTANTGVDVTPAFLGVILLLAGAVVLRYRRYQMYQQ